MNGLLLFLPEYCDARLEQASKLRLAPRMDSAAQTTYCASHCSTGIMP
jgi:hypothetical protein